MIQTESMNRRRSDSDAPDFNRFRIGSHRVNALTGIVSKGREVSRLEPRAMEVLVYLAANAGNVVSKSELKRSVWEREFVVDEAVKRCISQIRKAFRDDPLSPSVIETVRKRGYRLIAHVHADQPPVMSWVGGRAAIAATLVLGILLAGGVHIAGIVDSASEIDGKIDVHATAREAYSKYDRHSNDNAIALFEYLIERNSQDAAAYSGLADALMQSYLRWNRDEAVAERARAAAQRSRDISPDRPDALKALGAYYHFRGQKYRALQSYTEAIRLDPSYWMALNNGAEILRDFGEYNAARTLFQCALGASQSKTDILLRLADVDMRAGRPIDAANYLKTVLMLEPANQEAKAALATIRSGQEYGISDAGMDEGSAHTVGHDSVSQIRILAAQFENFDCQQS